MDVNASSTPTSSPPSALARKLRFPFFLLLLTILTYGLLHTARGFYLDDRKHHPLSRKLVNEGFSALFQQRPAFSTLSPTCFDGHLCESAVRRAIFALESAGGDYLHFWQLLINTSREKKNSDLGGGAFRGLSGYTGFIGSRLCTPSRTSS